MHDNSRAEFCLVESSVAAWRAGARSSGVVSSARRQEPQYSPRFRSHASFASLTSSAQRYKGGQKQSSCRHVCASAKLILAPPARGFAKSMSETVCVRRAGDVTATIFSGRYVLAVVVRRPRWSTRNQTIHALRDTLLARAAGFV